MYSKRHDYKNTQNIYKTLLLSRAHGNFEGQYKALEPAIIINYLTIIINAYDNYNLQLIYSIIILYF
jgi:hypothetical protein